MGMKTTSWRQFLVGLFVLLSAGTSLAAQRPFLLGTSIVSDLFQYTYENPNDKDLFSLHLDDFIGVPWTQFQNGTSLPASFVTQWSTIQQGAASSGKIIYLAVSPLASRKTLTDRVEANGSKTSNWAP